MPYDEHKASRVVDFVQCLRHTKGEFHIVDANIIGTGAGLRTAVIFFYLSNEGLSILENTVYLGLPVPEKLKTILAQLQDSNEEAE